MKPCKRISQIHGSLMAFCRNQNCFLFGLAASAAGSLAFCASVRDAFFAQNPEPAAEAQKDACARHPGSMTGENEEKRGCRTK